MPYNKSMEARVSERAFDHVPPTHFFVLAGNGGEWLIYREGVMNPVQSVPRKTLAVEHAKAMAKAEAPSEVLIEQRDGSFKVLYSFAPAYETPLRAVA